MDIFSSEKLRECSLPLFIISFFSLLSVFILITASVNSWLDRGSIYIDCFPPELINSENRTLVLKISLEDIKEDLVDSLTNKIQYNKGAHNLILNVKDIKNQNVVELLSRKCKINLDKNVIDDLKTINGLEVFIK